MTTLVLQPCSLGLKATQLYKWDLRVLLQLYLTTNNRNGPKLVVLNTSHSSATCNGLHSSYQRCVAEGNILVKHDNSVCRERLNLLNKRSRVCTLQLGIVAAAGANIAASVSYCKTIHCTPQLSDVLISSFSPICLFLLVKINSTSLTLGKTANQKQRVQAIDLKSAMFSSKSDLHFTEISGCAHYQANTET